MCCVVPAGFGCACVCFVVSMCVVLLVVRILLVGFVSAG